MICGCGHKCRVIDSRNTWEQEKKSSEDGGMNARTATGGFRPSRSRKMCLTATESVLSTQKWNCMR